MLHERIGVLVALHVCELSCWSLCVPLWILFFGSQGFIFMGVALDTNPDWVGWLVVDTIVALVFVAEARRRMGRSLILEVVMFDAFRSAARSLV